MYDAVYFTKIVIAIHHELYTCLSDKMTQHMTNIHFQKVMLNVVTEHVQDY